MKVNVTLAQKSQLDSVCEGSMTITQQIARLNGAIEIEKHVGGCPPSSEQQLQSSPSPISLDSHSNTGETYGFEIDSGSDLYGGDNSELRHRKQKPVDS